MGVNISRYRDRIDKEFEVEVVTPMFLGGANVNDAELRSPSLKGALRFWWRATCGKQNIGELKERESEIFGDTSTKSILALRIEQKGKILINKELAYRGDTFRVHGRPVHILDYLAYGTHKYEKGIGNRYVKDHISPGNRFIIKIAFQKKYEKDVLNALAWMVHYGGMGARSRNGFGSISTQIERPNIKSKLDLSGYTALSNQSRLFRFSTKKSWHEAHSEAGLAYRNARLSIENLHQYDRRKLISAPITVNKRNLANLERHAKPYFIHINKLESDKYQGQILYMPYRYLFGRPDFDQKKFEKYQKACEDINHQLEEISRGAQ